LERFFHAFRGIRNAWHKEPNFRIEALIGFAVLAAMFVLPLSNVERAILVLIIALVLALETINSLFERLLDLIHPQFSPEVKRIKDTMAGVVFLATAASVAVAGLILVRPLLLFDFTFQDLLSYVRTPVWITAAKLATLLGGWQTLSVVGGAAALWLLAKKRYKMLGLLVGGMVFGEIVLVALKEIFSRPRPEAIELIQAYGSSFPSGHVFSGTVFWLIIAYIFTAAETKRRWLWGASAFIIALITASRVILAVHWFSDVVGGLLLGLFWFFLWFGINERLFSRKPERQTQRMKLPGET